MKIVVCGNYGAKNLGDEMILEGLLTTLQSVAPNSEVTILSGNPKETFEKYSEKFSLLKIKSLPKFPAGVRSIIKNIFTGSKSTGDAVKNCNYFILGGGGLFGNLTFSANLIWAIQALKAYKYGKPVIIYGQSISPIRWKFVRNLVKKIFEKASLITVRDEASKEELQNLGVTKEIHVIPDLAFRLEHNTPLIKNRSAQPTLLVALRQMLNLTRHFQQSIAEFLDWLITNHSYQIKFINFQEGPEGDSKLHQKIAALMQNKKHVQHVRNIQSADELLHYFSESDFVLGMRLHAIISAIKTATHFIAINYSSKVENFLKTAELTDILLKLETLNFENLKFTFEKIQKNKPATIKNLRKLNQQYLRDHLKFEADFTFSLSQAKFL